MKTILQKWKNPTFRGLALSIASGGLILSGLVTGQFANASRWRNGLMLAAAGLSGSAIILQAWHSLRHKHVSIDLLVSIATIGALILGEYWEAAAVSFLFIFGAYLEARTLSKTRQGLQELLELAPATAIVLRDGHQQEVRPHEVKPGEKVLVKPGGNIPVDGDVQEGFSAVDQSAITGESMPEEKRPGSEVFAGTVNQSGLLKVQATGVGSDTTLARIIRRVEEAQEEKAPTQRFIERFATYYTPAIVVLSGAAYLLTRNLDLALTLLVIGCPGALVISTPVSIVAGIGRAAKSGILIKGGEYLENAGKISSLAVDKTGTITEGKPRVTRVYTREPERVPILGLQEQDPRTQPEAAQPPPRTPNAAWSKAQQNVLVTAAMAEAGSEHPLAQAVLEAAGDIQDDIHYDDFQAHTGLGVEARVQGQEIIVGSKTLMHDMDIIPSAALVDEVQRMKRSGQTGVFVARDGHPLGVLGMSDPIREKAPQAVHELKEQGVEVIMLTGDDPITARAIADQAGIDRVHAGLLPEEKLQVIQDIQREGHVVAMVGDGINDAPALAKADLGIAMGAAGTDIAIETADIALMADELEKLPQAIQLSKKTLNNIRQNVVIALGTVVSLLAGVLLGRIHMAGGMLIHEISVMVVILNAMRLMKL